MLTRYVILSNFQHFSKQYPAVATPALTFKLKFWWTPLPSAGTVSKRLILLLGVYVSWSRTSLKPKTRINDAETLNGTLNLVSEVDSRDFLYVVY